MPIRKYENFRETKQNEKSNKLLEPKERKLQDGIDKDKIIIRQIFDKYEKILKDFLLYINSRFIELEFIKAEKKIFVDELASEVVEKFIKNQEIKFKEIVKSFATKEKYLNDRKTSMETVFKKINFFENFRLASMMHVDNLLNCLDKKNISQNDIFNKSYYSLKNYKKNTKEFKELLFKYEELQEEGMKKIKYGPSSRVQKRIRYAKNLNFQAKINFSNKNNKNIKIKNIKGEKTDLQEVKTELNTNKILKKNNLNIGMI